MRGAATPCRAAISIAYDPQSGRFLTQDPIGLAGGVNLYAYAGNNPVSYSDPYGLCAPFCTALAGAVIGGGGVAVGTAIYNGIQGRPLMENVLRNGAIGAGAGAAIGLGYGIFGPAGAGTLGGSMAVNADKIAAEAQAVGASFGQQVGAVSRIVGNMRLGQDAAANVITQSIRKFGEVGPTVAIGGNKYVLAARAGADGVVNAIGVNAKGETFRSAVKLAKDGWEVVK